MKHLKKLHVQVLIGLACAVVLGIAAPQWAVAMKPIGQAFIALLKMMLAPIIFCTLVQGLAQSTGWSGLCKNIGSTSIFCRIKISSIISGYHFISSEQSCNRADQQPIRITRWSLF